MKTFFLSLSLSLSFNPFSPHFLYPTMYSTTVFLQSPFQTRRKKPLPQERQYGERKSRDIRKYNTYSLAKVHEGVYPYFFSFYLLHKCTRYVHLCVSARVCVYQDIHIVG